MKLWKKDKPEETGGFGAASEGAVAGASVTPMDVQEKKFRRSSRPSGGYVMREVDEFLDEITDTLTALIAENERLRLAGSGSPDADRAPSVPARDGEDRAAVDAFLQREKTFLQDLGGLVQAHAVELKSMARSTRTPGSPAEAAAPAPVQTAPAAEAVTATDDAATDDAATDDAATDDAATDDAATAAPAAMAPVQDEEPVASTVETTQDDPPEAATDTTTGVVAEEPIRLEEPEPARSGRSDDPDRSLRELFWGED